MYPLFCFVLFCLFYSSVPQDQYCDVIMGAMASQITSITIVYSTVYSGVDQRKHHNSASLAFVRGIHPWPVNSPHKWLVGPYTPLHRGCDLCASFVRPQNWPGRRWRQKGGRTVALVSVGRSRVVHTTFRHRHGQPWTPWSPWSFEHATVLNMLKTSRRPWRPWRCLNVLCTTLERPRQPFCHRSAFNGDLASYVVVQGRYKGHSPCVRGYNAENVSIWWRHHVYM